MTPTRSQKDDEKDKPDSATTETAPAPTVDSSNDESDAAQSPQETNYPRDPTQAIPDVALPRYLSTAGAAEHSNPQL